MKIGIPFEENNYENRVSIAPYAVSVLKKRGNQVLVTIDAGLKSGYTNDEYKKAGATIVQNNRELYTNSEIIVKVNAPEISELPYMREGQIIMAFFNLITNPELVQKLSDMKITAIAYELISLEKSFPILESMSRIAGKLSFSIGSEILSKPNTGKGVLLGGSPSASRSKIVVIGAGNAGMELIRIANYVGSRVSVFDNDISKQNIINNNFPSVETFYPYHELLIKQIKNADLILGATSSFKKKTTRLLSNEMFKMMEPRSVFIDLTIQSGGISETSRATELGKPIYLYNDIFHYCVPNIAATVPKAASNALSTTILPFVLRITEGLASESESIQNAICIRKGRVEDFLECKDVAVKQKQIEQLIETNDDDEQDVINWRKLQDKRDN